MHLIFTAVKLISRGLCAFLFIFSIQKMDLVDVEVEFSVFLVIINQTLIEASCHRRSEKFFHQIYHSNIVFQPLFSSVLHSSHCTAMSLNIYPVDTSSQYLRFCFAPGPLHKQFLLQTNSSYYYSRVTIKTTLLAL